MRLEEKQKEKIARSKKMADNLKIRERAVQQRMLAGLLLFICPVLFLGGCSDRAVSFTLDSQKESGEAAGTAGQKGALEGVSEQAGAGWSDAAGQLAAGSEFAEVESCEEAVDEKLIYVYVCGAVNNPGVVELSEGSRAEDALEAAGGLSGNAKQDYVNLAAKVEDEQMLYFPTIEEAASLLEESRSADSTLVNINTAGAEQLSTLPGIGASRASDIIAYREAHGAFESKEDIMQVSGIKESLYEKLCDLITVK